MRCPGCGEEVEAGWRFCPNCGEGLKTRSIMERFPSIMGFQDLFADVEKEFRRMEELFKEFELEEPKLEDLKRPWKRGGGVSIRITSGTGKEPKVEIETFGDLKGEEDEIMKKLGITEGKRKVPVAEKRPLRPVPKVLEEPETKVERLEDKMILRIKVPGVRSMGGVDIRKMQESIEVRAYAEGKAYFTLSSIPPGSRVLSKRLEGDELVIEIG
ncbi:MAG: zinc ribbon domain-containing protein [Candidatus Hydrothermarchaeota archaeon]